MRSCTRIVVGRYLRMGVRILARRWIGRLGSRTRDEERSPILHATVSTVPRSSNRRSASRGMMQPCTCSARSHGYAYSPRPQRGLRPGGGQLSGGGVGTVSGSGGGMIGSSGTPGSSTGGCGGSSGPGGGGISGGGDGGLAGIMLLSGWDGATATHASGFLKSPPQQEPSAQRVRGLGSQHRLAGEEVVGPRRHALLAGRRRRWREPGCRSPS